MQSILGGPDSAVVPIRIQVREAPRFKSRFGMGFGTEDKFRTFADLQLLQFPSGARRLTVYAKHSALEPYHFNVSHTNFNFLSPRMAVVLNPYVRRQKEPGFDVHRVGGRMSVSRQISIYASGFVSYGLERDDNKTPPASPRGREIGEVTLYNKSGIAAGLSFDNSRPLFTPRRGLNGRVGFEISGLGFDSPYHFYRMLVEVKRYHRVPGQSVFAHRIKIGALQTYQGAHFIPSEERLYSGGTTAFTYDLSELRYSFGAGLRFQTLIGPIRFDVARPFFESKTTVQYHLDVGHAF